jgi:putative ABC transport system permease protein
MIGNYLKVGLRGLTRNRIYTIINITGLTIGLGCFALIAIYVRNEVCYDGFYTNAENIYRINTHVDVNGISNVYPAAHYPAAHDIVKDFPEAVRATTMYKTFYLSNVLPSVKYGEREFDEDGFYLVDSTFFDVFRLDFKHGNPEEALTNAGSVVLTDETATRYFGDENPLGKIIQFQDTVSFRVTGVLKPITGNTHLDFDFLAQSKLLLNQVIGFNVDHSYVGLWYYSYVELEPGASSKALDAKLQPFVKQYYPPRYTENSAALMLQNVKDIHLYSEFSVADMSVNGSIEYVYTLGSIGVLVLIIACINFMNLSIARLSIRGKEVGMRKVMGAQKANLVIQFLGESLVTASIAGILSVGAVAAFIPLFNRLAGASLTPSMLVNIPTLAGIACVVLVTGILAGLYPALVMAAFQPARVLKGLHKTQARGFDLRKVLVVVQFSVSIILLTGTLVISDQLHFMRSRTMGFDREQVIIMPVAGTQLFGNFTSFKNQVEQLSNVAAVTSLSHELGQKPLPYFPMQMEGFDDEQMLPIMYVGFDFLETFGIEMTEGRFFDITHGTDSSLAFVINESAAKFLGWTDPIGRKVTFGVNGNPNSEVIGVIKDFNFDPLRTKVGPLIMKFSPAFVNVAVKMKAGDHHATVAAIENIYRQTITGDKPFSFYFLEEAMDRTYASEENLAQIFTALCVLAIFIASLGLFALASFSAERRLKEIGVRKVMGASEGGLVFLMYREFVVLIIAAFVVGSPLAYYFFEGWLANFAYHVEISPVIFVLSLLFIAVVSLVTVGYHSWKAARTNPIEVLRAE